MSDEFPEIRGMQAAEFEAMAAVEDRHWWFRGKRAIVAHLLEARGVRGRILDAGCGTGGNLPALSRFGEATGVEKDPLALEFARRKHKGRVEEGHLTELPFGDNEFDGIVTTDVMEHVPDDRKALAELCRVLKPGGTLLLTVPAHPFMWTGHDVVLGHVRRYTMENFRQLLAGQPGVTVETISYFNAVSFPVAAAARWLRSRRERLQGAPDLVSDTAEPPGALLNAFAGFLFASERFFLNNFPLPFGVSILAVIRKEGDQEPARFENRGLPLLAAAIAAVCAFLLVSAAHLTGLWLDGHEGPSYLFRVSEYRAMLSQGEWYPRWLPDFYWGYGYPLFVFYSPGLFALGSVFMTFGGLSPEWSLHLASMLSSVLLFSGCYRLSSRFTDRPAAALAGAVLAVLANYRFVQFYVRADLAEAFATALVPWAMAEGVDLCRRADPKAMARLAVCVAGTFFCHTITSVMTCAALGIMGTAMLFAGNPRAFTRVALGSFAGVLVASIYWVPAWFEQKYVSTDRMISNEFNGAEWHEHFVYLWQRFSTYFYYGDSVPGDNDRMPFSSSWAQWIVAAAGAVLAVRDRGFLKRFWPLAAAVLIVNLMMAAVSDPLWTVLPLIGFFQFPWRFLVLELVWIAPLAAVILGEFDRRPVPQGLVAAISLLVMAGACFQFEALIQGSFREAFEGLHRQTAYLDWTRPYQCVVLALGASVLTIFWSRKTNPASGLAIGAAILFSLPLSVSTLLRVTYSPMMIDTELRRAIDQPIFMQKYGLVLPGGKIIPVATAAQDEYLPKTARVDPRKPPESPVRISSGSGRAKITDQWGDRRTYEVEMDTPGTVEAAYFYYPGVQVDVDGSPREPGLSLNGLVTVTLDPGRYRVDVFYDASPLQKKAALLSLLGVIICVLLYASPAFRRRLEAGERAGG